MDEYGRERCERMLALNSGEELQQLMSFLTMIVRKIKENPTEAKFRSINTDSKALRSRVHPFPGGREVLAYVGFTQKDDGVEKRIEMDDRDLTPALEWLSSYQPKNNDVQLILKTPGTTQMKAAFGRSETVADVARYVEKYCRPREQWVPSDLGARPHRKFQTPQEQNLTLTEAGLAPRSTLTFVPADPSAKVSKAEQAAQEARLRGLEREKAEKRDRIDTDRKLRLQKLQRQRDVKDQRAAALRHFSADREDKSERVQREQQNRLLLSGGAAPSSTSSEPKPSSEPSAEEVVADY